MKTHILKTVDPFFSEIKNFGKRFEVRKNDRHFAVGDQVVFASGTDLLDLNEVLLGRINYICDGVALQTLGFTLQEDCVVFSFSLYVDGRWE